MWHVRAREKVGGVLGVYDGTKNVYFRPHTCYSPSLALRGLAAGLGVMLVQPRDRPQPRAQRPEPGAHVRAAAPAERPPTAAPALASAQLGAVRTRPSQLYVDTVTI